MTRASIDAQLNEIMDGLIKARQDEREAYAMTRRAITQIDVLYGKLAFWRWIAYWAIGFAISLLIVPPTPAFFAIEGVGLLLGIGLVRVVVRTKEQSE